MEAEQENSNVHFTSHYTMSVFEELDPAAEADQQTLNYTRVKSGTHTVWEQGAQGASQRRGSQKCAQWPPYKTFLKGEGTHHPLLTRCCGLLPSVFSLERGQG